MDDNPAGGRNTQIPHVPAATPLETNLENVAVAIASLLADARSINPERDEFGHARSRAYGDAVALLKASAKVGHTIAELRGAKFEHNINVRRQEVGSQILPADEENESTLILINEDTLWDWKRKRTYVFDASREISRGPASIGSDRKGTPRAIPEGSNGNSEAATCPAREPEDGNPKSGPRIRSL